MRKYIIISILTFLLAVPGTVHSQRVALVLSGGGAKGLTHIGVIQALEENNVPIDFVAGSSMGAIVAAMYAMGYTPAEMIEIVDSEDFEDWYTGTIEERYRYFFKQERVSPELVSIGIDLADSVPKTRLPLTVIPNKIMDFVFMELFSAASAAAGNNFDSLFVPFLCIGSDISNNREVVFRSGDLNQAVRASMTFPVYFRPILIDGNIMYDGGIYNNFPVDRVIEAFNPDVIIGSKAVDTSEPLDKDDLIEHLENMIMKPTEYEVPEGKGVLIDNSDIDGTLLSFGRLDEFVSGGYRNTIDSMQRIREYIQREAPSPSKLRLLRKSYQQAWPSLVFDSIRVNGVDSMQVEYIEKSITREQDTLDIAFLREEYLKLAFDNNIDNIYPRAIYDHDDSLFTLDLTVKPKTPIEADIGLYFSTAGQTQTYLGIDYRDLAEVSTYLHGNIQFGQLYNGLSLGARFDYPYRTPFFFDLSFQANRLNYNQRAEDFFFSDERQVFVIRNEANVRADMGIPFSTTGIISWGAAVGRNVNNYFPVVDFSSEDTADVSSLNKLSIYGAISRNTLDDKQYEKNGTLREVSVRAGYGTEENNPGNTMPGAVFSRKRFFWANLNFTEKSYLKLSRKIYLGYYFSANYAFKPLLSNYSATLVESPVFRPNALTKSVFLEKFHAYRYLAAGVMPVYDFNYLVNAKLETYFFMPMQELKADENNQAYLGNYFEKVYPMVNLSLNFRTPAGPITLNAGYLGGEARPWIVKLSFGYLIFNRLSTDL